MSIDVGVLGAKVNLITSGFDRGVKQVTSGFTNIGAKAVQLNQALDLVGRGFRILEAGIKNTMGGFITAADTAEKYRLRLNILLGSQKEGNRMFQDMSKFAASVPFEYEKIMGSATALAGVMDGGVDQVKQWMPMIADLAAVSGLSIEDTTGQVIRMYSAGAAAADMFRERGITGMLGFEAGAKVSIEQTRKQLIEMYESPTSKFRGASAELAKTWSGLLSMMSDQWFLFRTRTMDGGAFDALKEKLKDLLGTINRLDRDGTLGKWAKNLSDGVVKAITAIERAGTAVITGWNAISDTVKKVGFIGGLLFGAKMFPILAGVPIMVGLIGELKRLSDAPLSADKAEKELTRLQALKGEVQAAKDEAEIDAARHRGSGWVASWLSERYETQIEVRSKELEKINEKISKLRASMRGDDESGIFPLPDAVGSDGTSVPSRAKKAGLSKEAQDGMDKLREALGDLKLEAASFNMTPTEEAVAKLTHRFSELLAEHPELKSFFETVKRQAAATAQTKELNDILEATGKEAEQAGQAINDAWISLNNEQALIGLTGIELEIERINQQYAAMAARFPELIGGLDGLKAKTIEFREAANLQAFFDGVRDSAEQAGRSMNDAIAKLDLENATMGLTGVKLALAGINAEFGALIEKHPELADLFKTLQDKAVANEMKRQHTEVMQQIKTASSFQNVITGALDGTTQAFTDSMVQMMDAGKISLSEMGQVFIKQLKLMAAKHTAELLMEAAKQTILGVVALASPATAANAPNHWKAAKTAAMGAATMGSFVVGAGLSGMAHDGISSIPQDGTWLLKKNERVVDSETNQDLKTYLKGDGGKRIEVVQNITIQGGDEKSVLKALPQLKQMVVDIVSSDYSTNGPIRQAARAYA